MNEAGVEIGGKKLPSAFVKSELADARTTVIRKGCKRDDNAGFTIDLVDHSGPAVAAELTRHPLRIRATVFVACETAAVGRHDAQPVSRGRAQIDVGNCRVVERDAEDLSDIPRLDFEDLWRQQLAIKRRLRPEPHDLR